MQKKEARHRENKHCTVIPRQLQAMLNIACQSWMQCWPVRLQLALSLPPSRPPAFFPPGSPLCGRWASLSALRTGHAAFIAMCIA